MVDTVVCRSCGSRPCRCAAPAAADRSHSLRLLPPVAGTALEPVDAERFRMRRLGRLIETGDLAAADVAATAELAAILQFPRRRRWRAGTVWFVVAALAALAWCLAA
jgi:hypothetical protein